jgi:DnaJ-class molecular chaperone
MRCRKCTGLGDIMSPQWGIKVPCDVCNGTGEVPEGFYRYVPDIPEASQSDAGVKP